jgi:diguanylate cyclase (GGDEF)-like protein
MLEGATHGTSPLALLFLDLDHFKYVNDSFGHAVGDGLLREVAASLPASVRENDVVARFAGDEFVIALPGADRETAVAVADRVRDAIRSRRWQSLSRLTASVGVAVAERGRPTTRPELLIAADSALHDAKSNGRDQTLVYSGAGGGGFQWIDEIRSALDEDRLVLHGQPIDPAGGSGVRRYELLIRMRARDGGLIPPGSFIPAAEQFGMMVEVDRWVTAHGLELARRGVPVQINLSGTSLGDPAIRETVAAAVASGVRPGLVTFEVTETAAVRNIDTAREFAEELQRLGYSFALDDFGTGFGSLIYLRHLPVSDLKIDAEFVRDLPRSKADQRLVTAIVAMARPLGLKTVAEGVEDDETLELVREIGVDYVQGFGIAKPFELEISGGFDALAMR